MGFQSLLELLAQANALIAISLIFGEDLIDLGHLHGAFDLIDLELALIKLSTLLSDRPLVAID